MIISTSCRISYFFMMKCPTWKKRNVKIRLRLLLLPVYFCIVTIEKTLYVPTFSRLALFSSDLIRFVFFAQLGWISHVQLFFISVKVIRLVKIQISLCSFIINFITMNSYMQIWILLIHLIMSNLEKFHDYSRLNQRWIRLVLSLCLSWRCVSKLGVISVPKINQRGVSE